MNYGFSDHYADYAREFGISTDLAIKTMLKPDKTEQIKFSESFFAGFYLKKFPIVTGNPIYLVYGQRLNNNFSANRAFRLYDDLSPHVEGKRPTELLYDLANRFGFDVNIAGAIDRFFFQHSYMTDLGGGASPNVILTSNDPYLFEAIFFKTRVKEK